MSPKHSSPYLTARLFRWLVLAAQLWVGLLLAWPAHADLAFDNERSIRRWVQIENLSSYPDWTLVAYPYNFSGGAPQLGLARFEADGLATSRLVEPRIFALRGDVDPGITKRTSEPEALAILNSLNAVASDLTLGQSERVPSSSPVLGVIERLRIRTLTPHRLELARVALEYELADDKREVVQCDAQGSCPEPSSGPRLKLKLTQRVLRGADPDGGAAPAPGATSPAPPDAAPPSVAPSEDAALAPDRSAWIAFSVLLLLVVAFVGYRLQRRATPSDV